MRRKVIWIILTIILLAIISSGGAYFYQRHQAQELFPKDDFVRELADEKYSELEKKGVSLSMKGEFQRAYICFQEMLKRKESKNPGEKGVIYYCMGNVAYKEKKYSQALKYFEQAIKFCENQNVDPQIYIDLWGRAGLSCYHQDGLEQKALDYQMKSVKMAEEFYGPQNIKTIARKFNVANILYEQKKIAEAISLMEQVHVDALQHLSKDEKATRQSAELLQQWKSGATK